MRSLWIRFTVGELFAGSILADLADKVSSLEFGVVEHVPHTKNQKKRPAAADTAVGPTPKKVDITYLKNIMKERGLNPTGSQTWISRRIKLGQLKRVARNVYHVLNEEALRGSAQSV